MSTQRRKRWAAVLVLAALIFSTLSIVEPVVTYLTGAIPFGPVLNIALLSAVAVVAVGFTRRCRRWSWPDGIGLALVLGAYAAGILSQGVPAEKIHFPEYGLMAFLLLRAIECDIKDWKAYPAALILTGLVGWGDECVQGILPNRYYQLKDVGLNVYSGFLALALTVVLRRLCRPPKNGQGGMG